MKRTILALLVSASLAVPVAAQIRADAGISVPIGFAGSIEDGIEFYGVFEDFPFLPVLDYGFYYQFDLGRFKLGFGARLGTVILETVIYPSAFVEAELGRLVIEGQVGYGMIFHAGLASMYVEAYLSHELRLARLSTSFDYVIPDLSAWVKLDKGGRYRLGAGAASFLAHDRRGDYDLYLTTYLGFKAVLLR